LFVVFLVVAPAILLGLAARITRMLAGSKRALLPLAVRYSYAFVPLGFGMWLAHYGFHFFTGLLTIVPITQSALADLGWPVLGDPLWTLTGISRTMVQPLEIGFLILGLAGSLLVTHHLAIEDAPEKPMRAFMPWATVCVLLWIGALWLISQPMDMRGTFISG
jgi:hypothetical protein